MEYDFKGIEKKWGKKWEEESIFHTEKNNKPKYYVLEMFPYPSGMGLHAGHAFNFTIGDVFSRFKRMKGFNVLYPMGFDAFGLPAENAAIKEGVNAEEYTEKSIKNFIKSLKSLGFSYDWQRMIITSHPDYYKWDQWIFLKMFEKGLAYKKESFVNWCPKCKTVLANEQVHNGYCWRHNDTKVQIKKLDQWFFDITKYKKELNDFKELKDWPEEIKKLQKNWIGMSEGTEIVFKINGEDWKIFTTRPDTIYGVSFLVVSAQHPKLMSLVTKENKDKITKFLSKINSVSEKDISLLDKEGFFTGSYAIHPLTKEKIPVYVGNFVIADYGSGMVMAVPAHDQRDFEFAKKYSLPIKVVISPEEFELNSKTIAQAYTGDGTLINSKEFNGLKNNEAKKQITKKLEKEKLGRNVIKYKLKDWLISRQRYWGTPIPIVYCDNCKKNIIDGSFEINFKNKDVLSFIKEKREAVEIRILDKEAENFKKGNYLKYFDKSIKETSYFEIINVKEFENLKELLKDKDIVKKSFSNYEFNSSDLSDNFENDYFNKMKKNKLIAVEIKKIIPGVVPINEKDLPVVLPKKVKFGEGNPLEKNKEFLNVRCPRCGKMAKRETDTMDTFVNSSWYYLRYIDPKNKNKIFDSEKANYWAPVDLYIGGKEHATMHLIYIRFYTKFLRDLGLLDFNEPAVKLFNQGMVHGEDGNKMSKSAGNGVDPLEIIKSYGADSLRLFLISNASPDKDFNWSNRGLKDSFLFLKKVWNYFDKVKIRDSSERVVSKINLAIKEISRDIESMKYNLAVIKLKEIFEEFGNTESRHTLEIFLKLLSPFCPFISEELWTKIGNKPFISKESWPVENESKINYEIERMDKVIKKTVSDILNILKILKNKNIKKVYLYVVPFERKYFDEKKLSSKVNKDLVIFSTDDKKIYDPENKSKKAKPGRPSIYVE